MRFLRVVLAVMILTAGVVIGQGSAAGEQFAVTWQVRISNLTPPGPGAPGSQPMSPPVFAVHRHGVHVWQVGHVASHAVAAVAEDANTGILASALSKQRGVTEAVASPGGPIPSGQSATYTLRVPPGHLVSIVTMLVNTNDAFTGVDALWLPGRNLTVRSIAYDAGSEVNNERRTDIPGPCCNNPFVREPEGDVIRPHEGIVGRGDLSRDVYGWPEPVVEITFSRADRPTFSSVVRW